MTTLRVNPPTRGRSILGDRGADGLFPVQALHSTAETMFVLSLAGSLFFNVTVDAARPRILLYLALTMAPFAVLGPLIGPVIDRLRSGHRGVLILSLGGRAVVALLLSGQLKTLLLYPLAFVIVVLAKVFVVSRNALVPILVEDRDHLVVVNSRLARTGVFAGGAAAVVGLLLLDAGSAAWVLRAGAGAYALGALAVLRVPPPHPETPASPIVESAEMHGPGIHAATVAMAGMRAAAGFVFFHVGFSLKTSGEPPWVLGAVVATAAIGSFAGTFIAPWLRRRTDRSTIMTIAIIVTAVVSAITALRFHPITAASLTFTLGLASSVARRAFDGVVQTEAPHARRGQAYAGLETRLELAWVAGALAAVVSRAPNWLGVTALALGLTVLAVDRVLTARQAARIESEVGAGTLPFRLMETAEAVASRGDRQQAVLVALAAADAAALVGAVSREQLDALREQGRRAAAENDPESEAEVLRSAHELVSESVPEPDDGTS